jgi:para-nitrobenzyl esterase
MKLNRRTVLIGASSLAIKPWRFVPEPATAYVKQGTLQGTSNNGVKIFLAVPFAAPPIDNLRFKLPQPPKQWSGTRDATKNAPAAMQSGNGDSEDCLYLNIFAPADSGNYPVYVWIHGGGNTAGGTNGQSGISFARNGIVVVTLAYRLGAFGYLPLDHLLGEEYASSGVNGIQDLTAALQWIQENIHAFGGDPSQVTIGGHSAGAKNVSALLATPNAKGTFHRAIMQSGSGQTVHRPQVGKEVTTHLLRILSIEPSNARDLLKLTSLELLKAQQQLQNEYPANFPFRPTIGSQYLPNIPEKNIVAKLPLLIGTARDESLSFFDPKDASKPIQSREVSNIPYPTMQSMEQKYRQEFPKMSDLDRRVRLLTAEEYWMPSIRFAENHAASGAKTFMYRFNHANADPTSNHYNYAVHGAEYDYAWNHHDGWNVHETWCDFIHGQRLKDWPKYDTQDRLTILYGQNGNVTIESDPYSTERKLWDNNL